MADKLVGYLENIGNDFFVLTLSLIMEVFNRSLYNMVLRL